ncbi:MAG: GNA1162 family protein, partial [Candidatus Thermoplasmatota archaeon]
MKPLAAVGIVALVALAPACAGMRSAEVTYRDPKMDFSLVQKVAVLPFENLTTANTAAERVRDVFMTMMQATGSAYIIPPGEVARGVDRASVAHATSPTAEDVVNLGKVVGVDAVITGVVREYGEVRSGSSSAGVVSVSLQMMETQTGKVVWSASATRGGVDAADRLFGGGGQPMDQETADAVRDLLESLFG